MTGEGPDKSIRIHETLLIKTSRLKGVCVPKRHILRRANSFHRGIGMAESNKRRNLASAEAQGQFNSVRLSCFSLIEVDVVT